MQKSRALFLPSVEMSRGIVQAARPTHARCTACPPEVAGRRKSMISSAKPGGGIAHRAWEARVWAQSRECLL